MREAPAAIAMLVADASDDALERRSAPGKWSVRQILCHLADCELVFAFRLRAGTAHVAPAERAARLKSGLRTQGAMRRKPRPHIMRRRSRWPRHRNPGRTR